MTELDIVNRALAFLGSHLATSMADTDKNAARAISSYPECRDEVLRLITWTCCLKRDLLWDCAKQATPWTASHRYGIGERVTNDTNKTYICTVAGKSAAAGGPTGTGTDIVDNLATWSYEEASTAAVNWCHWVNTAYQVGDFCSWDTGKVYVCTQAGTSAAATHPVETGTGIIDGTARWDYYTTIRANRTVYAYQYIIPYDCVKAAKVPYLSAATEEEQGVQYKVEGRCLYTDQADSFLQYVWRAPVNEWDAMLRGTVAFRIAAEIAFDVTGQKDVQANTFQALASQYTAARQMSLHEGQEGVVEQVRWENV